MMNTVRMPRQHNRHLREIQRQKRYLDSIADGLVTLCGVILFVLCLWGATEAYDWVCMMYSDNNRLESELREEKAAFKAMFVEQAVNVTQHEEERKAYVKKWQQNNPKLAGIFNAR